MIAPSQAVAMMLEKTAETPLAVGEELLMVRLSAGDSMSNSGSSSTNALLYAGSSDGQTPLAAPLLIMETPLMVEALPIVAFPMTAIVPAVEALRLAIANLNRGSSSAGSSSSFGFSINVSSFAGGSWNEGNTSHGGNSASNSGPCFEWGIFWGRWRF